MTIKNCTPHALTILGLTGLEKTREGWKAPSGVTPEVLQTIPPSGIVPRASQGPATVSAPIEGVPTQTPGAFGAPEGLPTPEEGTYLVVSLITVQSARAAGRTLDDLLSPGDLVRDAEGKIIGCLNLSRHA